MSTITSSYVTPVPAATAWRGPAKGTALAWRCLIVRTGSFVLHTELLVVALALAGFVAALRAGWLATREEAVGAALVFALCRATFYLTAGHRSFAAERLTFAAAIVRSAALALIAAAALLALIPRYAPDSSAAAAIVTASSLAFYLLGASTQALVRNRRLVEDCLIVGGAEKAERFFRDLLASRSASVLPSPNASGEDALLVEYSHIQQLAHRGELARIVVVDGGLDRHPELTSFLIDCKLRGLAVEDAVDSYERLSGKIWVEGLRPEWLIYSHGFRRPATYLFAKRALDIVVALGLLLLTAPLMLLVAAAIKLESPGPVIFAQERVGHHGRTFTLYKFRSMWNEAERQSGPVWAGEGDRRVTPLGRFLRKCRLDELPQFWNVLKGEMSFVGPRPERPYFVDLLKAQIPFYDLRHYVRPGITGWAQVQYPYGASIEDAYQKLQYDLYYIKRMSVRFDLRVLLKTVQVVLLGRGAR